MSSSEPKTDEAPASAAAAGDAPSPTAPTAPTAEATPEQKPETEAEARPAAAGDKLGTDEPVWPPPESQPSASPAGDPVAREPEVLTKPADPEVLTKPADPEVLTKPADKPQPSPAEQPAAEPKQEMALSESTLHWLVDADQPIEAGGPNPILAPLYDPKAPVAGRRHAIVVIGGAAILALGIAWALHAQAARHRTAEVAPAIGSADMLVHRAEAALAQGRSAEALDLARLAIVTDSRLADAYIIMGIVQRGNGQVIDARDSYRRYLELAPIGTHAAEARAALTTLPP